MFVGFYHHSTVSHRKRISHLIVCKVQVFKLGVHVGLVVLRFRVVLLGLEQRVRLGV